MQGKRSDRSEMTRLTASECECIEEDEMEMRSCWPCSQPRGRETRRGHAGRLSVLGWNGRQPSSVLTEVSRTWNCSRYRVLVYAF